MPTLIQIERLYFFVPSEAYFSILIRLLYVLIKFSVKI
jgi:hypothetical protein